MLAAELLPASPPPLLGRGGAAPARWDGGAAAAVAAQVLDAALRLTTAPDSDGVADAPESSGVNGADSAAEVCGHGGASLKSMAARAASAASSDWARA